MRTHTSGFKTAIKTFGRQIDSKISYIVGSEIIELGKTQLNSVSLHYKGAILKSAMKQLDIDSNVEIPVGTEINYQFGAKVSGSYEYLDYGNYIVYKVEKQEDLRSYKITCYDKMLYAMKDYENSNIVFPITVRDYINAICTKIGLTFANSSSTFANYNRTINNEPYLDSDGNSLGYTFRDILDELAEVTASTICINDNDELEIRYINTTNDTIDEEFLKDINVNFGEKFGAVNIIVLSRSADSDSVYYPSTLPANPIEIKISDNQIMNGNDRADYLPDIYAKLNGLEYYINDFKSTGICYYDLCDKYNVTIGDNTYSCIMFNDEINITQGLEENVNTEMPKESETEYKYASTDDRQINQVYVLAKKNEGKIEEVVSSVGSLSGDINEVKTVQTDTARTIDIITTHIDKTTGEVTEVTTTTGFTFNAEGMSIKQGDFEILQTPQGAYYKEGNNVVGQYTKDGSKQKDLSLFGVYYYGMDDINDTPMFVAQLYNDENGEECMGHFYNRGD